MVSSSVCVMPGMADVLRACPKVGDDGGVGILTLAGAPTLLPYKEALKAVD